MLRSALGPSVGVAVAVLLGLPLVVYAVRYSAGPRMPQHVASIVTTNCQLLVEPSETEPGASRVVLDTCPDR